MREILDDLDRWRSAGTKVALARGMAAALPFVDRFVEGHSLDAMEQLADILDEP